MESSSFIKESVVDTYTHSGTKHISKPATFNRIFLRIATAQRIGEVYKSLTRKKSAGTNYTQLRTMIKFLSNTHLFKGTKGHF